MSPRTGTLEGYILKDEKTHSVKFFKNEVKGAKRAATEYRVLDDGGLTEVRLLTGRTHQIRVHMASIGCPVVGDFLYGTEIPQLPGRFALHASALTLHHPMTGDWLSLTSPLPESLATLLD